MPNKKALQALINDPNNWLMGEVTSSPTRQALPMARDTIQMIRRLQGGLSRVPTSVKRLLDTPINTSVQDMLHPSAMAMQEKMFQEANPIFKRLQAKGLFDRFQGK